jgi:hypothetical protein
MDVFDNELLSFWKSLNTNNVKYIMVVGIATNLHGYQRATDDVDIWIKDTNDNRRNLRISFREYGMGDFDMMERMQFVPGWTYFNLNNGLRLDVMIGVKGLEGLGFDQCFEYATIADIDDVKVPFLHINHLIESKRAANRPKDQIDVIYLEKIKKLKDEMNQHSNPL